MSPQPPFPPPNADDTRPLPPAVPPPPGPHPRQAGRRGGRISVGVVVAAVVLGGLAGYGGSAVHSALDSGTATGSSGTSQVVNTGDEPAPEGSVQAVAEAVLPSVVRLDVAGQRQASGSGVVVSEDGEILTNEHVVAVAGDEGQIRVRFSDGSRADAAIVGTDPLTDTALIKAEDVDGLTPITVGKSANLDVGERVVAVGSPFGLDSTVTTGIVSALDRPVNVGSDGEGNSTTYPAIQTDAAINPGNSGGALVDMNGHLVGINSSIRTAGTTMQGTAGSIGLGFAIPIDEVLPIVEQMRAGEQPTHARLGIVVRTAGAPQQPGPQQPQDPFESEEPPNLGGEVAEGAEVQEVNEGSAAEQAGLREGDVITRVDDRQITSADALVAVVRSYRPGDDVEVTYERDGDEHTTTLTLESDGD